MNREHGTYGGYQQHLRSDKKPCESCRRAGNRWRRDWRARNACTAGLGWPLRAEPGVGPAGQVPGRASERSKKRGRS